MIVPQGYEYYIDSFNTYHLYAIVPYSTYQYRVEVLYPVSPNVIPTPIVKPEVTINDLLTWVTGISELVSTQNDVMNQLATLLLEIGREIVSYEDLGNEKMFKRIVCYYAGHYLELHLRALKDEENRLSLSPEKKNETQSAEIIKLETIDSHMGDFKKTIWGQMYWSTYYPIAKLSMIGVY
jgi:hypothetical protein